EREQLAKDLKSKGMADAVIASQLDNPDKYTLIFRFKQNMLLKDLTPLRPL
ncbi:MAG: hypothetical protein HC808_16595, partial [Candidatus Competibacteraceae bacterium]|nr:hypothetical protein [Candidatus Competibacteraceae bacterium]